MLRTRINRSVDEPAIAMGTAALRIPRASAAENGKRTPSKRRMSADSARVRRRRPKDTSRPFRVRISSYAVHRVPRAHPLEHERIRTRREVSPVVDIQRVRYAVLTENAASRSSQESGTVSSADPWCN